jgi:hypothetical protein
MLMLIPHELILIQGKVMEMVLLWLNWWLLLLIMGWSYFSISIAFIMTEIDLSLTLRTITITIKTTCSGHLESAVWRSPIHFRKHWLMSNKSLLWWLRILTLIRIKCLLISGLNLILLLEAWRRICLIIIISIRFSWCRSSGSRGALRWLCAHVLHLWRAWLL